MTVERVESCRFQTIRVRRLRALGESKSTLLDPQSATPSEWLG